MGNVPFTPDQRQKIAYYHEATAGAPGVRINGEEIPGIKGKELLPPSGKRNLSATGSENLM